MRGRKRSADTAAPSAGPTYRSRVVDLEQIVRGEYDENVERLAFQSTEVYDIYRALAQIEKAAAEERAAEGRRRGLANRWSQENFLEPDAASKGQVRDKIGAFAGLSGRTVEKIQQVREAARAERRRRRARLAARVVRNFTRASPRPPSH